MIPPLRLSVRPVSCASLVAALEIFLAVSVPAGRAADSPLVERFDFGTEELGPLIPKGDVDQPGQIDLMYSLRAIDAGWTTAQKQQAIDWFARASKWRGGSTFSGHVNNIFDATIDAFTDDEKQVAYRAAPLFAPITDTASAPKMSQLIMEANAPDWPTK